MFAFHRFFDFCVAVFSGRAVFWGGGWERAMRGVLVGAVMAVVGGGTVAYAGDSGYVPGSCPQEFFPGTVAERTKIIFGLEDLWCWGDSDFSKEQCELVVKPCLKWIEKNCNKACLYKAFGVSPSDLEGLFDDEIKFKD